MGLSKNYHFVPFIGNLNTHEDVNIKTLRLLVEELNHTVLKVYSLDCDIRDSVRIVEKLRLRNKEQTTNQIVQLEKESYDYIAKAIFLGQSFVTRYQPK